MRGGSRGSRERGPNYLHDQDGDHYIPNYERDGYTPAPRYSSLPDSQSSAGGMGYPMIGIYSPHFGPRHGLCTLATISACLI